MLVMKRKAVKTTICPASLPAETRLAVYRRLRIIRQLGGLAPGAVTDAVQERPAGGVRRAFGEGGIMNSLSITTV